MQIGNILLNLGPIFLYLIFLLKGVNFMYIWNTIETWLKRGKTSFFYDKHMMLWVFSFVFLSICNISGMWFFFFNNWKFRIILDNHEESSAEPTKSQPVPGVCWRISLTQRTSDPIGQKIWPIYKIIYVLWGHCGVCKKKKISLFFAVICLCSKTEV